jgi:hypothetical protein
MSAFSIFIRNLDIGLKKDVESQWVLLLLVLRVLCWPWLY